MGRHSSVKARGWRGRSPVIALSALLVLALVGWFTFDFLADKLRASSCDTTTTLNVTASPDIAPVISRTAREVSKEDKCYEVRVTDTDSEATAESLVVSDGTEPPDVWIPESTIWLQRAQARGASGVPVTGTSVASSPVVLAVTEDAATQLGWPAKQPTWGDVLGSSLKIGLPDPAQEPVGVSLLFGVRDQTKAAPDPATALTTELRRLTPNVSSSVSGLFDRLPGNGSEESPLDGFPVSENAVLRNNARGGTPLVAAYADPPVPALDYPYVVLPEAQAQKREAAEDFLTTLMQQDTADALSDAGFRTPDGEMLRSRGGADLTSTAKVTPAEIPQATDVDDLLNVWAGVNLSGRVQILLDVSGSMAEPVPGTNANRLAVTLKAAGLGIGLMKPSTKIGVWLFSTKLDGDKDYREFLPVLPISEQAANGGLEKLQTVQALPNGATGLYDSVLAAYQSARQNYEAGRINVVIVLTDGKNEDPNSISRESLLAELAKLQDPRRPILIVGIGIGPDIDVDELQAISGATGGQAFTTPDPTKIGDIFYAALSRTLCQPPKCTAKPGS
ncbi:substrate-binding and VWA domain-containing protein [Actinophytocola oryzae]|uniref:von Willebrand factor type A domain-containing protein n=1 Tax=Actinophytocola oryzae TaxID=502181 RepID=A0A4R7UZQ8_9PSEU|nr:substrate-binding and VWA domain-containing protein [Actinophytocola oryzae]TDV41754.1 von Willebrand factor type A domain-containing protein [Actinophytocola oryzae]